MWDSKLGMKLCVVSLLAGCGGTNVASDAGDSGVDGSESGPSTAHCTYVPLAEQVVAAPQPTPLTAAAGEVTVDLPLGITLGGHSDRGMLGGFSDGRPGYSGQFAPAIGVHTLTRIKALVLAAGDQSNPERLAIVKVDLGAADQQLLYRVEQLLGPSWAGRVIVATSHSHSAFGGATSHSALGVGFGPYLSWVNERLATQIADLIRSLIPAQVPARWSMVHRSLFDADDSLTRDRRDANDALPGGDHDDQELYFLRVDASIGQPIAAVAVFGVHGTVLGSGNPLLSGDAPRAIERGLEDLLPSGTVVMHLQGAGGDVAPAGIETTQCPRTNICGDYGRLEILAQRSGPTLFAVWNDAAASLSAEVTLRVLTTSFERGPDVNQFVARNGTLRYAPWDGITEPDGRVFGEDGTVISPIDEFNAPYGAAQCGEADFALVTNARLPGADRLTPVYRGCQRLELADFVFEAAFGLEFEPPPICGSTRTTLSAVRLSDWVIATMPGEPNTTLARALRDRSNLGAERLAIIGYAQDHQGYLMTAEDWLQGGYEPSVTFWGPLDGEQVIERSLTLMTNLLSSEATTQARGTYAAPVVESEAPTLPTAIDLSVPSELPDSLTTRLLRMPVSAQPQDVPRFESTYFVFQGNSPLLGTPSVRIERNVSGTWQPLTRDGGRDVEDEVMLLTWHPAPLLASIPDGHFWVVEWQAVPVMSQATTGSLPLGEYRFQVAQSGRTLTSEPFSVVPGTLTATGSPSRFRVVYRAPQGFRLLGGGRGSATGDAPVRSQSVELSITDGTVTAVTAMTDDEGFVTTQHPTASRIEVRDEFGNSGELAAQ